MPLLVIITLWVVFAAMAAVVVDKNGDKSLGISSCWFPYSGSGNLKN